MIKQTMYRYLGRNGIITSEILLENISPIQMVNLRAEQGHILTNGTKTAYDITVFMDEVENWKEIEDTKSAKNNYNI